jgi:hypothetical protein
MQNENTINKTVLAKFLQLTGWTGEQLNLFVYETAEAYLAGFIPSYPQVVTQIMKSPIFWNWWRSHWKNRDVQFMEKCYGWDEGSEARIEVYQNIHDAQTLLHAIYLNGQVLEESYAEMIGQITKAQLRQEEVAA